MTEEEKTAAAKILAATEIDRTSSGDYWRGK